MTNILDNMTEFTFLNMCCVLFERSEYENEFKCPVNHLHVIPGSTSKKETFLESAKSEQSEKAKSEEISVCFEKNDFALKKNSTVQGYSCSGFKVKKIYKLISGLDRHSVMVLRWSKFQKCYLVHELIYDLHINYINFIITK